MKSIIRTIINFVALFNTKQVLLYLPYVLTSTILAARGKPTDRQLVLVIICTTSIAMGAMVLTRLVNAKYDARNPRTAKRGIASGRISRNAARIFTVACFAIFMVSAHRLGWLVFALSPIPIALFVVFAYSKRFTSMSHYLLGVAMGIAPIGGWIAVQGHIDPDIFAYAGAVLAWYVGFDLLYALNDVEFFKKYRLKSIPSKFGTAVTILIARNMHMIAYLLFFVHGGIFALGIFYFIGLILSGLILLYEHYMLSKYGILRLNKSFFFMNTTVSLMLFTGMLVDLAVYGYRA
jgi:4-hydroxybenzoate polyprenyltransferase